MTEDPSARLAGLARVMATPLPDPEELAAGKEQDRAMAERICKARPGIPLHHAYAVLETLRTIQRVEAAKRPASCPPECAGGHLYDGACLEGPYLEGVIAYGRENGQETWAWRCEDVPGCEGLLSLNHGSAAEARRSYDRHCKREHQNDDGAVSGPA